MAQIILRRYETKLMEGLGLGKVGWNAFALISTIGKPTLSRGEAGADCSAGTSTE